MSYEQVLRLDTVPGEILDGICDFLDKKELKAFRLSNRRISDVATTHLAKVYMTNLCSLMTRRSLEKLAKFVRSI
jgi:RAB protein geranylgeranyltransferase component A